MRVRAHADLNNSGFLKVGYLDYWIAKYDLAMPSYASPKLEHVDGKKESQEKMLKRVKKLNCFQAPLRYSTSAHLLQDN